MSESNLTDDSVFEPNRKQDLLIFGLSVVMLVGASMVGRPYAIMGGLLAALFKLPVLFVFLCVSYFLTRNTGKWHLLHLALTTAFCIWIVM